MNFLHPSLVRILREAGKFARQTSLVKETSLPSSVFCSGKEGGKGKKRGKAGHLDGERG
jgi:hypothetical protein